MRPDSWETDRGIVRQQTAGLDLEEPIQNTTVLDRYLGGSPVNPAFAIGVDVEQNQTLHQIREDQLKPEDIRNTCKTSLGFRGSKLSTLQSGVGESECDLQQAWPECTTQLRLQSQRCS